MRDIAGMGPPVVGSVAGRFLLTGQGRPIPDLRHGALENAKLAFSHALKKGWRMKLPVPERGRCERIAAPGGAAQLEVPLVA